MCTEKYLKSKQSKCISWATYGSQFFLVPSLTVIWIFLPLIPLVNSFCWLARVDPVLVCMNVIFFNGAVASFEVQLLVLIVYLWTLWCCAFLVLSSLTRIIIYGCISSFWTRLGAKGESEWTSISAMETNLVDFIVFTLIFHRNTDQLSRVSNFSSFVKYHNWTVGDIFVVHCPACLFWEFHIFWSVGQLELHA